MQIKNLENEMAVGQRVAAELVRASQGVFPTPDRKSCNPLKYGSASARGRLFFRFSTASSLPIPQCVRPD